jgi:hypothetical protein
MSGIFSYLLFTAGPAGDEAEKKTGLWWYWPVPESVFKSTRNKLVDQAFQIMLCYRKTGEKRGQMA